MNCNDYQQATGLTDAQLCKLLNECRPSPADPPVFEHRLAKLKRGKVRADQAELKALLAATDEECDRYEDA